MGVFYDRAEVAVVWTGHDILDEEAPGDDCCNGRHRPREPGRNDARHASIMTQRNETQMRRRGLGSVGDPPVCLLGLGGVEDAHIDVGQQLFGHLGTAFQPLLLGEHSDLIEMIQ